MPPLKAQLLLEESLSAYFPEMVFTDSGITVQLHRNTQPNRTLANLPALELEDALYRVLVEPQQGCNRPVTERWVLLNHVFDRGDQMLLKLGRGLDAAVVPTTTRQAKPAAELADGDINTFCA